MLQINIALFGIGNVGSTLLTQIIEYNRKATTKHINVFCIANSTKALLQKEATESWQLLFDSKAESYVLSNVFAFAKANNYTHPIVVDVTASESFTTNYIDIIENGFHIVTANKIANSLSYDFYLHLRNTLHKYNKAFLYETNVGAGLPLIETIKNLHESGESIHKIRGVFSGSLSYLFNNFSKENKSFTEILFDAGVLGLTEPDAREDLSGKDVARKLLILAREVGLTKEVSDVKIQSLVPEELNGQTSLLKFRESIKELDAVFTTYKSKLATNEVLRHIGELDLKTQKLEVKLVQEPISTALGQTQGADAVFEIFTDSYYEQPLVIKGAGAGKEVTARGVLSDVLKITQSLN